MKSGRTLFSLTGLLIILSFVIISCTSAGRQTAWQAEQPVAKEVAKAEATKTDEAVNEGPSEIDKLKQEAEETWKGRLKEANVDKCIELWKSIIAKDPGDWRIMIRLARGYYLKADSVYGFNMEEQKDLFLETLQKGTDIAERALVTMSPEFAAKMKEMGENAKPDKAITVIGKEGVPAMFWYATNLGKWAKTKGFTTILYWKDTVKAIMEHVLTLDEEYLDYGPHRYFGVFYSVAPAFAGGDMNKSKKHFELALEKAPLVFGTKVLYAQNYLIKTQDRDKYEQILKAVVSGDPNTREDVVPENIIEQKKAKILLDDIDEYF